MFKEVTHIKQIIKAVDHEYLMALCNHITNSISTYIDLVLQQHLFNTYSDILNLWTLQDCEDTIKKMTYNDVLPVDSGFNIVDNFVDFFKVLHSLVSLITLSHQHRFLCHPQQDWQVQSLEESLSIQ